VGGITPENLAGYAGAGAAGFGIGSSLYKPGVTPADLAERAARFVSRYRQIKSH
jgi:2-dehydro-3-deoxyphosphogalactonate aldolase